MPRLLLALVVVALYALHQDLWFWREARPLVFGFLPIGLAYHAAYCVAIAVLMWVLTRVAWPAHLERAAADTTRPAFAKASARSRRSAERGGGDR
jgi:hypothetical protein